MYDLSLMMVTYNRLILTKQTLNSLFVTTEGNYNLIIVDNGSTDGTVNYLKTLSAPNNANLLFHYYPDNTGVANGRNKALKIADDIGTTQWYATIDNDVEMPKNWNNKCIDILKANKSYGQIGVNMEGAQYPIINKNGYFLQHKPKGNLGTACSMFPKAIHKMIGFFCNDFEKYAHEDADFSMRIRFCGFQVGYIAEMGHHFGVGDYDIGEYREFKNKFHKENLTKFYNNCSAYAKKEKSLYIPYSGD